ncbi:MAG TPA: hypothetical protein VGH20_05705 [Myxococcales bacterium]|jgi:hypothetical protein
MITLLCAMLAVARPPQPPPAQPAPRPPASQAELRQRIESYLGYFETTVPEQQWKALGPAAVPILNDIAQSSQLPSRRVHALGGLVALQGTDAQPLLSKLSLDEGQPLIVRLVAVRGLAHVTPDSALLARLRPVLRVKDDRVGSEAAEALAERVPKAGCGLVRTRGAASAHFAAAVQACAGK